MRASDAGRDTYIYICVYIHIHTHITHAETISRHFLFASKAGSEAEFIGI